MLETSSLQLCSITASNSPQDARSAQHPHAPSSHGTHCEKLKRSASEPYLLLWLSQHRKRQAMCRLLCAASHHLAPKTTLVR